MKKIIYVHGKGGSADEAEHYKKLFPQSEVIGFDYKSNTPWAAKEEFARFFSEQKKDGDRALLIANSIGAFFSMMSLSADDVDGALFISPIVDMERLITDMMKWAGVTEDELRTEKSIATAFGETLSWEYLCYVREHPVGWRVPTHILYGENDSLTSFDTISGFSKKTGAPLAVMPGGEHWFHTEEQMRFLDRWVKSIMAENR